MNQPIQSDLQPPRAQPVASHRWHVQLPDQTVFGPVTSDELKELVRQKILTADCRLQREGKDNWFTPSQVFPKSFPTSLRPKAATPSPPTPIAATTPSTVTRVVLPAVAVLPIGTAITTQPAAPPLIATGVVQPGAVEPQVSVTENTLPRRTAQELAGMAMIVIPAAIGLVVVFGLIYTFGQQQGWEVNRVNPGVNKFVFKAGLALLCGLAGLGAFLGKAMFGDGAGEQRPQ